MPRRATRKAYKAPTARSRFSKRLPLTRSKYSTNFKFPYGSAAGFSTSNAIVSPYQFARLTGRDPFVPGIWRDFTYTDQYVLTNGAVGVMGVERVLRLNSLYDPDATGAGHQPYGYDQITAIYQKYKVHACTFEVSWWGTSNSAFLCAQVAGPDDTSVLAGVSPNVVAERPNAEMQVFGGSSQNQVIFRKTVAISDIIGMNKLQFKTDIDGTTAQYNANPVRVAVLRLAIADPTASLAQDGMSMRVLVKLTFHSQCWSRITAGQS